MVHAWRALVLLALAACGGRVSSGDAGAPSSTSASQDRGPDGGGIPCPLLAPNDGDSCTAFPEGDVCAYVGGGIPCQSYQCDGSGVWTATHDGC